MLESLNQFEGLIALISLIVTIIIAIIGFYINKNITTISQNQSIGNQGKGNQAGNDIVDESQNVGNGSNHNIQSHGK